MEFVDIAGLMKGAAYGEGLGNKLLANIRAVEAIAHVTRCFEDSKWIRATGKMNPQADFEVIETELMLADIDIIDRRLFKAEKLIKTGDKKIDDEVEFMKWLRNKPAKGELLRRSTHSEEGAMWLKSYNLLSTKPELIVANVAEGNIDKSTPYVEMIRKIASKEGVQVVVISGKTEG